MIINVSIDISNKVILVIDDSPLGRELISIDFIEKDFSGLVRCNKPQVRRIMDNLLSNAVKFPDPGTNITVIL
tara:strand:+ start:11728 stop:11946 length:219 start_codon:yes stop_codon:yes gene_type:complete